MMVFGFKKRKKAQETAASQESDAAATASPSPSPAEDPSNGDRAAETVPSDAPDAAASAAEPAENGADGANGAEAAEAVAPESPKAEEPKTAKQTRAEARKERKARGRKTKANGNGRGNGNGHGNGNGNGHGKPPRKRGIFARIFGFLFGWLFRWFNRHAISLTLLFLLALLGVGLLAPRIFITIPAGHVGVLWERFLGGTDTDKFYTEGVTVIFPWDEMYIYDARLQNDARTYDTISSNGLSLQVEIATRYRLNQENVGLLHKLVGPKYPEILVYPEIGSHARDIIARYTPEQLYSDIRSFIQAQILERMVTELGASLVNQSVRGKLIEVEDVLIRSVVLPETVQKAIERKAEQYQAMLEYDFRLAREEKEKVRKSIEAEGIAAFQAKVADSITDEYLRLRGIEATVALAASRNSKMVIIGGKDGLPLILNTGETPLDATGGGGATGAGTNAGGLDNPVFSRTPQNARIDEFTPANSAMPDASTGFGSSGGATTTGQSQGGSTGTGRPSAPGSALAPSGDGGTAAREAPQAPNEMTGMAPSERSQSAGSGMNETPGNVQAQPSQPQTGAAQSGQSTPQDGQRASEINRGALNQDIPSTLNSFADRYRLGTN